MTAVVNGLRNVRIHWKKSLFASGAMYYGIDYLNNKSQIDKLMRAYCEEAVTYGDIPISAVMQPKRILVVLNPTANKRSAEKTFNKYCDPILQMSGLIVDVVKTESAGHARKYIEELEQLPSAIIVAGGDGTLSETVTGLMRRSQSRQENSQPPVGVLPLGRTNSVASKIFQIPIRPNDVQEVKGIVDSAIAIVRWKMEKKDVMKIQVLKTGEKSADQLRPIFACGSLQWGAYRDAIELRDKYWYTGALREYMAIFFNSFRDKLSWSCKAQLIYTPPCLGCSNCFEKPSELNYQTTNRWWSRFIPKFKLGQQTVQSLTEDFSKIVNQNCSEENVIGVDCSEILVTPEKTSDGLPDLNVKLADPVASSFDFINESWSRIGGTEFDKKQQLNARTVKIIPEQESSEDRELFYSIDNEPFEVRAVKITLLPKAINFFIL